MYAFSEQPVATTRAMRGRPLKMCAFLCPSVTCTCTLIYAARFRLRMTMSCAGQGLSVLEPCTYGRRCCGVWVRVANSLSAMARALIVQARHMYSRNRRQTLDAERTKSVLPVTATTQFSSLARATAAASASNTATVESDPRAAPEAPVTDRISLAFPRTTVGLRSNKSSTVFVRCAVTPASQCAHTSCDPRASVHVACINAAERASVQSTASAACIMLVYAAQESTYSNRVKHPRLAECNASVGSQLHATNPVCIQSSNVDHKRSSMLGKLLHLLLTVNLHVATP